MHLEDKIKGLKSNLKAYGKVIVAFSAGVDSTFLLKIAKDVLSDNVLALTIVSPLHLSSEADEAKKIALRLGVRHEFVKMNELEDYEIKSNPKDRCYFCKLKRYSLLKEYSMSFAYKYILDGTNKSDENDYRPGFKAIKELEIETPLLDAGLTKEDIRALSKRMNLETHDKPAYACLATRLPHGVDINESDLRRVEEGELFLRSLIPSSYKADLRLRVHGDLARIEVSEEFYALMLNNRKEIDEKLRSLSFRYVTIDLKPYRSGSMTDDV